MGKSTTSYYDEHTVSQGHGSWCEGMIHGILVKYIATFSSLCCVVVHSIVKFGSIFGRFEMSHETLTVLVRILSYLEMYHSRRCSYGANAYAPRQRASSAGIGYPAKTIKP